LGRRFVVPALVLVCIVASAPAVSGADAVAKPQSAGLTRLFHGPVAATLLQDGELADLRGAALAPDSAQRQAKRRVILWDEAHHAEVTPPGTTDAGNSITSQGVVARPAALVR
jgi:hypothetical protein